MYKEYAGISMCGANMLTNSGSNTHEICCDLIAPPEYSLPWHNTLNTHHRFILPFDMHIIEPPSSATHYTLYRVNNTIKPHSTNQWMLRRLHELSYKFPKNKSILPSVHSNHLPLFPFPLPTSTNPRNQKKGSITPNNSKSDSSAESRMRMMLH